MKDLSFLNKLCDPNYIPVREFINTPFQMLDRNGYDITVATGRYCLIALYLKSDYPVVSDFD